MDTDHDILTRIDARQHAMAATIIEIKDYLKVQNGRIGKVEVRQSDLEKDVLRKHAAFTGWLRGVGGISIIAALGTIIMLLVEHYK